VLAVGLLIEVASGRPGAQYGLLIATAALIMKKFGSRSDDADEDVQGSHATTRALFQAADSGGYDDLDGLASEDFRAYANGYPMFAEEHDQGPELLVGIFDYLRKAVPNVRWELYGEVAGKQPDKSESVAIRFVARGTIEDAEHDIEIAAFVRIVGRQMAELRLVTDLTAFNVYRAAIGLPILE
jgi:ketosteroid isomerase-like protein